MKPGDRVRVRVHSSILPVHLRGRYGNVTSVKNDYVTATLDDIGPYAFQRDELVVSDPAPGATLASAKGYETAHRVRQVLTNVADLVEVRNRQYGDAALNPTPVLSDGNAAAGLRHRIDEKLARLRHQIDDTENPGDTLDDLIGSLALLRVCYQDTGLIL